MTVLDAFDIAGCDDQELSRRALAGDGRARRALIERYLPLARSLALRYRRTAEPLDDLMQVAALAVIKTVDRWDPSLGNAFSSFAVPTILGELRRHFRDTTWMVRPPRGLLEIGLVVERAREPLGAELGREPTVAELAERVGHSPEDVAAAMEAFEGRSPQSLDVPIQADGQEAATIGELIGADDDGYALAEDRTTIQRLSSILDDRARDVLRMRFADDLLQSEIAAAIGCSQMQVSRIIRTSLERLVAYASADATRWTVPDAAGSVAA